MIQYFKIKNNKNSKNKFIIFKEKLKKFDKAKETYISKGQSLAIFGESASGKTKQLMTIWNAKNDVWGDKQIFIILSGLESLANWIHQNLKAIDPQNFIEKNHEDFKKQDLNIEKEINKQYIKIQMIINKSKNAIVFIDDIDKITGKKLEIIKEVLRNAKQCVITAKDEHKLDKTIKRIVDAKKPQVINLSTNASFDATNALIAMFIMGLFITGQYELSMMVMITRYMMKGKQK